MCPVKEGGGGARGVASLCRLGVAGRWHVALMPICVGHAGHVTFVSHALRRERHEAPVGGSSSSRARECARAAKLAVARRERRVGRCLACGRHLDGRQRVKDPEEFACGVEERRALEDIL